MEYKGAVNDPEGGGGGGELILENPFKIFLRSI